MGTLTQEIFATGTWNGMPFVESDLHTMAKSFNKLSEFLKVPLKIGHNPDQKMTDGQPAIGWVSEMKVVGEKLVATFTDVPDIMMQAFEKKLYRSVSIELSEKVIHKGTAYDFVITAVALLGAEMPAVNVLNDLAKLMSANCKLPEADFAAGWQHTFSSISGNRSSNTMTPEEEAKLRTELAEAQAKLTTQQTNFSALETKGKDAETAHEEAMAKIETDQKKVKVDAARLVFTTILEDAVKSKQITPAQREAFTDTLRIEDDDAVLELSEESVKALFGAADDKGKFSTDTGKEGDDNDQQPGDQLSDMAYAHMEKSGTTDFSASLSTVMRANRKLAGDYIDGNGETK